MFLFSLNTQVIISLMIARTLSSLMLDIRRLTALGISSSTFLPSLAPAIAAIGSPITLLIFVSNLIALVGGNIFILYSTPPAVTVFEFILVPPRCISKGRVIPALNYCTYNSAFPPTKCSRHAASIIHSRFSVSLPKVASAFLTTQAVSALDSVLPEASLTCIGNEP